jgi:hypothetical protein
VKLSYKYEKLTKNISAKSPLRSFFLSTPLKPSKTPDEKNINIS